MYNRKVEFRAENCTPVGLAFIGDAVFTLYVRERVLKSRDSVVGTLHTEVSKTVNATSQAKMYDALIESGELTSAETDVARRAKNAHLHSRAKTATVIDYHKATALEAVIGYVHLTGDTERESYLLERCMAVGATTGAR